MTDNHFPPMTVTVGGRKVLNWWRTTSRRSVAAWTAFCASAN
jgi:hypothetical protein